MLLSNRNIWEKRLNAAERLFDVEKTKMEGAMKTITETVISESSCKTFANALNTLDLAETLRGEGPFTLFVPSDEAFAKVNLSDMLNDGKKLKEAFTYHVLEGKYMAAEVAVMEHAHTLNVKPLTIREKDGEILIDNGKIVRSDIECSNGVIHVVDAVFLPQLSGWYGDSGCC
ncbi:MAG: beta-Ig-H3/fasciclin [Geobacteraceae bacterium]|jgi:uncharacterized surface protein with fasciclin (FAS1) repeats|nr:beta-Ig-H3/fasciclin [Geobacteraceae bacterium]